MTSWYVQKTLFLATACSVFSSLPFPAVADRLTREPLECEQIDADYQEVYSFATENYYINICQQNGNFFYHRQSKLSGGTNIFVRASTVFRGSVYQAKVGKTSYFVGIDGDRYYSSVMHNSNEIVFEPEVDSPASASNVSRSNSSQTASSNISTNASLEVDRPVETASDLVCARDKSAFHPELDGWQQLIGKSVVSVNKFAVSNGHDFIYDRQKPSLALITTQAGAAIDLSIASNNEIVERVCIQADSETESL